MLAEIHDALSAKQRIAGALSEIINDPCDRRTEPRIPYFGPTRISLPDADLDFSAFIRDISLSGVGLVHIMPLARGEVVLDLPLPLGHVVMLRVEILWCRDYSNGWYASGGRLIDVA